MTPHYQHLYEILAHAQGYIFPNEIDLQWGILIVVYPFITGLVAGAFILASLESLKPLIRLHYLQHFHFCWLQQCHSSVISHNRREQLKL
jgi:hypothetical protein